MSNFVRVTLEGPLATLTFAREKGLNILSSEVLTELDEAWGQIEAGGARACVLHGDGKVFLAGADIKEMAQLDPAGAVAFAQLGQRVFARIENSSTVSIAALHGAALGGGCELALACDIRVAADPLKIGQPEVNLGLIPGFGGTQRLPRIVGEGRALQMILTGEALSAQEALAAGLVTKVAPPEQLVDAAKQIARTVAAKGPQAVAFAKHFVRQALGMSRERGLAAEAVGFGETFKSGEAREGMAAFLEKRAAKF
ncbi:MAG: enoyl-CoA hydratase-related protein [Planctomycetota bacterium]|nr:enoyl-CoA hydratase-related protein [Planctomycetota bacterium]